MLSRDDLLPAAVIGVDPGSAHTGVVWLDNGRMVGCATFSPQEAVDFFTVKSGKQFTVAIERPAPRHQYALNDVYDTCILIGRLIQVILPGRVFLLDRGTVRLAILGRISAKNVEVNQALRSIFHDPNATGKDKAVGTKGTKKKPGRHGPLFGIKGDHCWSALAVAVAFAGRKAAGIETRCEKYHKETPHD